MNRFRYGPRLAIALATAVVLASACGSGGDSMSDSAPAAGAAPSVAAPESARDAEDSAADTAESSGRRTAGQSGPGGQDKTVEVVPTDRAIVYTAQMTVRAKDVGAAAEKAKQIVTAAGGYLAQEKSDSYGSEASSTLVFKIPPAGYSGALGRLGEELGERESIQQSTEDVTEEVADVESRVTSAKSALESLRALLKRADTIGQVLDVEREIAGRQAELESLQARQKKLAALTGMATLTLNLIGPAAEVPEPAEEPRGFLGGLETGWESFVSAVRIGLTVLGVLLPWLLVIVPVGLAVAFLLRRRRSRPAPGLPPDGTPRPGAVPPGGGGTAAAGEPGEEPEPVGPRTAP
ncbi:hypothetical protein GCM10010156_08610 [Planobispora rosea]|uniref:DUF4349 domain-containing protein n=1 Tax=Planobispora rosea TaxID=35762 RepID=A0A8J3WCM2_PLARO|nr:DUF4349 domain-containing protein [Planobispora rosea]GGS52216.1 hypothetical protein GCM10010156_08610 [Planobispora rosea]GIH83026.1 hypothetical protein Pro02_14340 [Planobispora rosea]